MNHTAIRGLLWLGFLLFMLAERRYVDLIAAWQVWLIVAAIAAVAVATMAAVASRTAVCDHPDHDHGPATPADWRGTVVHALPLLGALSWGGGGLGHQAAGRTGMWMPTGEAPPLIIPEFMPSFHATPRESHEPLPVGTVADASVPQRLDLHRLYQPSASRAERVVILGKLETRLDQELLDTIPLPSGVQRADIHGVLYRFVMICCAADARPAQVVLTGVAPPTDLHPDAWLEATGVWLRPGPEGLAGIRVERWELVPAPAEEYLAPY